MYWHTATLPENNSKNNLGFGAAAPEGTFGGSDAVKLVNKAARTVAQDKGVNIVDWEPFQAEQGNALHPSAAVMMPAMEELLKFA